MPPRHSLFHRHPNRSQLSIGTQDTGEKQPYSDPAQSPTSPSREENRDNISPRRSEEVKFYQVAQSSAIEENPDHYYQRDPRVAVNKAEPKRRRFFGLGGSSAKDSGAATPRLERRQEQPQPVQHAQQRWSIVEDGEEDDDKDQTEDGGAGLRASHFHYITGGQPTLDNDPLRSPAFPPALTHEEYLSRRSAQQGATPDPTSRQNFERLSSYQSPWDKTGRQAQQHSREESGQQQTPSSHHPSPSSATSTTSHPFARRAPHEPLHQYYQEHSSRPSSAKSLEASPIAQHSRALESYQNIQDHGQDFSVTHLQSPMGPSATQQSSSTRRSSETAQQNLQSAGQGREGGAYQPYSQQGPILSSNGPQQYSAQLAPQGQIYRGGAQPSPMVQQGNHEQGRSTPPPSRSRDDLSSLDNAQLLARHDELRMLVFLYLGFPSSHDHLFFLVLNVTQQKTNTAGSRNITLTKTLK